MKTSDLPAYVIADLIKTKQVSAVEVLEDTLERISQVDGRTGQVCRLENRSLRSTSPFRHSRNLLPGGGED